MTIGKIRASTLLLLACAIWVAATLTIIGTLRFNFGQSILFMLIVSWLGRALCIAWMLIPTLAGIYAFRLLLAGQRRPAAKWSLMPVLAIAALFLAIPLSGIVRFGIEYEGYSRVVDDARHDKCSDEDRKSWTAVPEFADCAAPALVLFDWGGLGSSWNGIIYDASDEISKPSHDRSASWKGRDVAGLLSCSGVSAKLTGHFYLAGGSFSASPTECD
jgi:hypothetical protein